MLVCSIANGPAIASISGLWQFSLSGHRYTLKFLETAKQCRLDACGGNDRTLTMQAVTTIELAPADVCADCGARLLEEREVKDPA